MVQKKSSFAPKIFEIKPTTTMITQSKKSIAGITRSNSINDVFILNKLNLFLYSKTYLTKTKIKNIY